jgi:hypothetical protein
MAEWWENQILTLVNKPEHWVMYFDVSLKLDGGGLEYSLYLQRVKNSSMFFKSFGKYPTTRPSTRHFSTSSAW